MKVPRKAAPLSVSTLNASASACDVSAATGKFTFANKYLLTKLGKTLTQIVGKTDRDLILETKGITEEIQQIKLKEVVGYEQADRSVLNGKKYSNLKETFTTLTGEELKLVTSKAPLGTGPWRTSISLEVPPHVKRYPLSPPL